MTAEVPVTAQEFARLARFKPHYVRQLKMAGRLVMTDNGKGILPQASLARIEETRDNPEPKPVPAEASFSDFAAYMGRRPSYVTELRKAGRLVLTADGKRVNVAESIALIEATRDPARAGVARRHAAEREAARVAAQEAARAASIGKGAKKAAKKADRKQAANAAEGAGGPSGEAEDADASFSFPPEGPYSKQRAKILKEIDDAKLRDLLRKEAKELGLLFVAEEVTAVVSDAITTLRTSMENLPGQIAPGLAAATTEEQVRVLLTEAIEARLGDLSRTFSQIGKGEA